MDHGPNPEDWYLVAAARDLPPSAASASSVEVAAVEMEGGQKGAGEAAEGELRAAAPMPH